MIGYESLNTDALLNDDISPTPIYVEITKGKFKGVVGYTFFWDFPMIIWDKSGNEYFITTPDHVRGKEQ